MNKTGAIRQTATFKATPHQVYEALMDAKKHAQFTGGEAEISRKVGGKFSTFDGWAQGENVELVPDQKIVQTWHCDDWPDGHFSQITISLTKVEGGTRLSFHQTGIPQSAMGDIKQGWREFYWEPMKKMLAKK